MALEIWAHGTKENPNNLLTNKNRKCLDLFNPDHVKGISLNNAIQLNMGNNESPSITCNVDTKFARDTDISNVSHISSNGYYGYCGVPNITKSDNFMDSDTVMEFDSCHEDKKFERKKRNFIDDPSNTIDNKRFKYEDEIYDNFRQTSFDPNATSIGFNNTMDNQNLNEETTSTQMDLSSEMMVTNDSQVSLINKVNENTSNYSKNNNNNMFNNKICTYFDQSRCMSSHMI